MIKFKLMSILLSGCLATGIGAGNLGSNFKNIKPMDPAKIIETIKNNIDKNVNENKDNSNNEVEDNTSNEDTTNTETNNGTESNETSNEVPVDNENNTPEEVEEETTVETPEVKEPEVETPAPSEETNTGNTQGNTGDNTQAEASDKFIAEIEQAIFTRVNKERAAAGLPALQYNKTMEHYARIKSQDMGDRGYFDHRNPEGQLITTKMQADGVSYRSWGENIAYISGMSNNAQLATRFMDNWMNSSGHRANILSSNFSSIGIGVYKIGNTYYATQEFYR
jgi:uncharacterized protein YkwD